MKTKILVLLFSVVMITALAQETCIRYSVKTSPSSGYSGGFRDELCYDEYGMFPTTAHNPYQLGIEVNGELLLKWKALVELRKPIWGELGNQKFKDLLPEYIESVDEYIYIEQFPWFSFDTLPSLPKGHELVPCGYELRVSSGGSEYMYVQGATLEMAEMLLDQGYFAEWRPWNKVGLRIMKVVNPEYAIVEAQRTQMYIDYENIISTYLVQSAIYKFPKFYYPKEYYTLRWWIKTSEDANYVEVTPDKEHPLYSDTRSGYIDERKIAREQDKKSWNAWINSTISYSGDQRVKKLLGY
jgi:hypothetical protein